MNDAEVARAKARLLEEIEEDARQTAAWTGRARFSDAVMAAMAGVPRHTFVPEAERECAYTNRPRPIGHGQTISQPFIVALMTDLIEPRPDQVVLEIGTGSGYQAAVLAELVARVYTIEIVPELARSAAARLAELGYDGVEVRAGDGWHGWPEHGPYDAIVVTAAGPDIPPALVEQLKPGGRMVLPLRGAGGAEQLTVVTKRVDGGIDSRDVLPVMFVPLTGDH
jgi:protein-L-isoaspartate(D-aspartate) O-methyltransferase